MGVCSFKIQDSCQIPRITNCIKWEVGPTYSQFKPNHLFARGSQSEGWLEEAKLMACFKQLNKGQRKGLV